VNRCSFWGLICLLWLLEIAIRLRSLRVTAALLMISLRPSIKPAVWTVFVDLICFVVVVVLRV
jgi:hypothetical protein